jgi:hypothetical protein
VSEIEELKRLHSDAAVSRNELRETIERLQSKLKIATDALRLLEQCQLDSTNCESVEIASKRVSSIARLTLFEINKL